MSTRLHIQPAPVRSMTGFALVRAQTGAGELTVSIRTVNHRSLDLHFHQPGEFGIYENDIRKLLRQEVRRGHVEIRISLARDSNGSGATFDRAALGRYIAAFRSAAEEFELETEPDLSALLALPGVIAGNSASEPLNGNFGPQLLEAVTDCLHELNAYREREGAALLTALRVQTDAIDAAVAQIRVLRGECLIEFQARLREKLSELLAGASISDARLVEEAAILIERSDIEEELTRLSVHAQELRRMLDQGGELGKRLDFLLQEMNRETNTVLSKSSGAGAPGLQITNLGLGLKANIEAIREQALNLE
jgi:uncharacterized protein (TIGR00255 family)